MPRFIVNSVQEVPVMPWAPDAGRNFGDMAIRSTGTFMYEAIPDTFSIMGPNGFELTMTSALHAAIQSNFHSIRQGFMGETQRILDNPFGPTSIDAGKESGAGQWSRLVHSVEGSLGSIVSGKTLALKGTGLNMTATRFVLGNDRKSSLTEQFRTTHQVKQHQERYAPQTVRRVVSVAEVYGVTRWRKPNGGMQEWMLMEQVEGGTPVETIKLGSPKDPKFAFRCVDHPELATLVDPRYPEHPKRSSPDLYIPFSALGERLAGIYRVPSYRGPFSDFHGDNILRQETEDGPHYKLIDLEHR